MVQGCLRQTRREVRDRGNPQDAHSQIPGLNNFRHGTHADSISPHELADVPKMFNTPEIRVDCPDKVKFKVVDAVTE